MGLPTAESVIRADGPWTHRDIAANTARFHIAEAGAGPLVVLLHGFPMFWWTWRKQITDLADAGYRVVAMDLRGYGGSDQTPHGYDPITLAADVNGLIRSLGASSAVVVGHGWGGMVAWALGAIHPEIVAGLCVSAMPHPADLRRAILKDTLQRQAVSYGIAFQLPFWPEHQLTKNDAKRIADILQNWSGTNWPDEPTADVFRAAMLSRASAHCALEYYRWAFRSVPRADGRRFQRLMRHTVHAPVLHLHGALDKSIRPRSAEQHVSGDYKWIELDGVGHFPHEEDPTGFSAVLLEWLGQVPGYQRAE